MGFGRVMSIDFRVIGVLCKGLHYMVGFCIKWYRG